MSGVKNKKAMLWLGSFQSDEIFRNMLARNIGQASGFTSQKGLIKGLDSILDDQCILDTIGVISYPAYPKYPLKKAEPKEWSRTGKSKDINIGYMTLKYITYLSRQNSLTKEVKTWAKERAGSEENIVIVYEPSVAKMKSATYLKQKHNASIFVVIPDIPKLVDLGASRIIKLGKKLSEKKQMKLFEQVDGFILYSSHMAEYYGFSDDRWMLMEGVFDPEEAEIATNVKKDDKCIKLMYCGALDEYRGIPQLLDAFAQLQGGSYELWLTGAGRSENLIRERQRNDPRIKYFGYLDSRKEVLELEQQADILIHTRDLKSPAAPYCFPSKLFEYLVTGKSVLSVDIPGIPKEYFKYMIKIEDLTVEKIREAIHIAVSMDDEQRKKIGEAGKTFVLDKKNSTVQAQRMIDFMNETR